MNLFKLLRGKPTIEQISEKASDMIDMLESIEAITENYLDSQREEAALWVWNHKEKFSNFNDAYGAYLEQRK